LRGGVEDALLALGQGFLAHADNQALRAALQSGALSTRDFFSQLLRLVYRLIFLLTVEERGVLHPEGADEKAKTLYGAGYSLRRLRERSVKRSAHDRFADLWEALKIVFRGVESGEPRLGLPALAGIFTKTQCPTLDAAQLENRALLLAVFKLSWLREESSLSRVNWRDMGPEELGSVYESLLELVPQVTKDGRQFAFATGGETKGNARKTTGSYYTPDSLVQVLLDSALEPVVQDHDRKAPGEPSRGAARPLDRRPGLRLRTLSPRRSSPTRRARRAPRSERHAVGGRVPPRASAGRGSLHLRRRSQPDGRRALQGEPVDGGRRAGPPAHVPQLAHPAWQRAARHDAGADGEGNT
jgi:hypothetical protein